MRVLAPDGTDLTARQALAPAEDLAEGEHTVQAQVSDNAGGVASSTWTFQVDYTPPTILPPPDVAVDATSAAGAQATWPEVWVEDNRDPLPAVAYDPPLGSLLPIGANLVLVYAVDAAGNESYATFNVTVRGAYPPPLAEFIRKPVWSAPIIGGRSVLRLGRSAILSLRRLPP